MFKMLNSKKGFTLVELMIVVVIMAILVAVAVPIYGAVTKNAQKKTCAANIREIESMVSQYAMGVTTGNAVKLTAGTATLTTNANGDGATYAAGTVTELSDTVFTGLFQKLPYCPVAGNIITITVAAADATSGAQKITAACDGNETGGEHV